MRAHARDGVDTTTTYACVTVGFVETFITGLLFHHTDSKHVILPRIYAMHMSIFFTLKMAVVMLFLSKDSNVWQPAVCCHHVDLCVAPDLLESAQTFFCRACLFCEWLVIFPYFFCSLSHKDG